MDKYEFKTTAHNEKKIIIKEEEVKKKMEQYLRQERYVKTMFTIEKEA